jgi:hypothetical protein
MAVDLANPQRLPGRPNPHKPHPEPRDTYVLSQLDAKEEYPDLNPLQRSLKRYEDKSRAAAARKRAAAATAEARGEGTQREVEELVAAASDTICEELFAEAATEGAAAAADGDAGAIECPAAPEGPAAGPEAGWPAELAELLTAGGGAGDGDDEGDIEVAAAVVAAGPTEEAEFEVRREFQGWAFWDAMNYPVGASP